VNSPNPLARFAHRNRINKSIELTLSKLTEGSVLDYGCGSGVFVARLLSLRPNSVVGYEPFMSERAQEKLPVYSTLEDIETMCPFSVVTLFETMEHLSEQETVDFLSTCDRVLDPAGGILVSGPIEVGPALIAKEFNRSFLRFRAPEYGPIEFIKASIFGIPGRRAENIKTSHRGFDFRRAIALFERLNWSVEVLHYGPLPIDTWYGNSQVYLWLTRRES
jgi:SAM-dependent methyltransferase